MKIKTVYLDLDGVLADFETAYNNSYSKKLQGTSIPELAKIKKTFSDIHFFRDLPLVKNANKLVNLIYKYPVDVRVLTSVGKHGSKENAIDKVIWLKNNFPKLANKFSYVTTSSEKAKFAKPDVLLIDDREKSTTPFAAAGGQVVLYKSFSKAKSEIEKLLSQ